MKYKRRTVDGIECPNCLERIWSRHRHDMRWCFCGQYAVDGGRDYMKVTWDPAGPVPKSVRIKMEDLHRVVPQQRNRK